MPEMTYSDEELGLHEGWDTNSDGTKLDPNIRREIRESRKTRLQLEEARKDAESAKRQLALRDAGIPNDTRGNWFAQKYDGQLDAESVKTEWEALFGSAPGSAGSTESTDDGTATAQRIAAASDGGAPGGDGTVKFEDALKAARNDPAKIRELIANAPPEAGIRLPEIY